MCTCTHTLIHTCTPTHTQEYTCTLACTHPSQLKPELIYQRSKNRVAIRAHDQSTRVGPSQGQTDQNKEFHAISKENTTNSAGHRCPDHGFLNWCIVGHFTKCLRFVICKVREQVISVTVKRVNTSHAREAWPGRLCFRSAKVPSHELGMC